MIDEVRRVADDQVARAAESLAWADEDIEAAVHDARKRFKKIRALVRIVRPGIGKTYERENTFYRDLGRGLSDIRDAQVMFNTVADLKRRADSDAVRDLLVPVCEWAYENRRRVSAQPTARERAQATLDQLVRARKRIPDWKIETVPAAAALVRGLRKTFARARKRHEEAVTKPKPSLLHEWRKRVKYHWYHCRLLREAWHGQLIPRIAALDELADSLGDDHDLSVLARVLRENTGGYIPDASILAGIDLATRVSREHRARAFAIAPRLFVESPDALAARLETYWTTATLRAAS